MKTLCLFFAALIISMGASAQVSRDTMHNKMHNEHSVKKHDMYSFMNGKLMMNKNGMKSDVMQDVTLSNGTTITPDGKITWKNGKTQTLKDGEWVDMEGRVHAKKMKSGDWKNKPDTTRNY